MLREAGLVELNAYCTVLPHHTFQLPGSGTLLSDVPTAVIDVKAIDPVNITAASSSSSSSSSSPSSYSSSSSSSPSSSSSSSSTLDASANPPTPPVNRQGKDVVLVVDVSGSMEKAIRTVRDTVRMVQAALESVDRIAIVTFGDCSKVLLPLTSPHDASIKGIIDSLKVDGCTNMHNGIISGIDLLFNNEYSRLTLLLLLSDGAPNMGITNESEIISSVRQKVAKLVDLPVIPQLVVHSFGFTVGHNSTILRSLTTTGNGGNGLYYYLSNLDDISAAIGDCLGSVKNVHLYGLRVSATPLGADGQPLPGWVCFFYDGKSLPSLTTPTTPVHLLGYLAVNEQRNVVAVAQPLSVAKKAVSSDSPTSILVQAYYCDASTREEKSTSFQAVVLQGGSTNANVVAQHLHVQTHVLRLRVSEGLQLIASGIKNTTASLEQVHELILQTLSSVQEAASTSPLTSLMEDESILLSLEKDLGQALETAANALSSHDKARLQQYSHEHANQRSASSATELRATYSIPEQTQMRAQFGTGAEQKMEALAKDEKAKVQLEEVGLTQEQKTKRLIVDEDVVCFVTLENWRTAHVGIGLLVQPLTMRERYKRLVPQVDFAQDYICTDAYNLGARSLATRGVTNRDRAGDQHSVVTSSTRGRINAWLPLYINASNWKYVRHWAPSAFSIIATQVNDKFHPIHAIKVCAKLLNSSVVKFMSGDVHLSDRALQQYADIHRLLLEMVAEHPTIQQAASKELENFIQKPWVRGRDMTPDIGNLIQYLTVSDSISWDSFKDAYIQESFRRNCRWIESRFPKDHPRVGPDAPDDVLLEYWNEGTSVSTKLMLFNVLFLDIVAHPDGKSMDDVKAFYDSCWGRLTEDAIDKLKIGAVQIGKIITLQEVMARVGMPSDDASIVKLIRWAYDNEKEVPIPVELKKAEPNESSNAIYSTYLQQRKTQSMIVQTSRVAATAASTRSVQLNGFFYPLLPSTNSSLTIYNAPAPTADQWIEFKDLWTKCTDISALPPLLAYLHIKQATGKLVACPSGKAATMRANWLQVPVNLVLKEMIFSFGSTTVFVLSHGNLHVDLYCVGKMLGIKDVGRLSTSTIATSASGCLYTSISPFCTMVPAYHSTNNVPATNNNSTIPTNDGPFIIKHVVVNRRVMDLGLDTLVYMSGGCEGITLCMCVGEVLRLLENHVVVSC